MNKTPPIDSEVFRTRDFWLAGALLASGKNLLRLDWQDGRAHFIFADLTDCEQATQAYWAGDLNVSAKAFTDALRTLKDRLHGNGKYAINPEQTRNRPSLY